MSPTGRPPFVTVPWCSFAASHAALHGILSALFEREGSGQGQWVETNLAQALTIHEGASSSWYSYLVSHRWPDAYVATPPVSEGGAPMHHFVYRLLVGQTNDGRWLQFAQNRPHLFEAFMRALDLEWMLTDPKWKGIPILEDEELRVELLQTMLAGVRDRTLEEWQDVFDRDHDVFAELYRNGPEVLEHPQLVHDAAVVEIDDPERGPVRQPGPQFRMTATPAALRSGAPTLDDSAGAAWDAWRDRPALSASLARAGDGAPLAGVTILELAVQYAAPYGVTLLADLGARVIKVEPLEGDSIRRQQTQFPEVGGGKVMQGKDSIAVDIRTPEGLAIVHQLARSCRRGRRRLPRRGGRTWRVRRRDVARDQPGSGVPERDGVRHRRSLRRPRLLRAELRRCRWDRRRTSRRAGARGSDDQPRRRRRPQRRAARRQRHEVRLGRRDRRARCGDRAPARSGGPRRGVGGQALVSSMLLSTAHAMASDVVAFPGAPEPTDPGPDMRGPNARYRMYDAADGWVFLAAPQPREWDDLADALAPYVDLRADPRFATEADRDDNDTALTDVLTAVFATRDQADWQRELTAADVACVAVTTGPPEALLVSDEYGRASGYITDVSHPIFDTHPRLAPIVRFSRSATHAKGGDLCGSATDAVLDELGYTHEQIADLRDRLVVG